MTTLAGYDIAGVNGPGIITTALGGDFVIVKVTEGITWDDPLHDTFVAKIRAAGLLVGHYHYAHPNNDVTREADHFIARANPMPGEVMALDFEPYNQTTVEANWPEWIIAFCARVKAVTGASCWVYMDNNMATKVVAAAAAAQLSVLRTIPIWKARYTDPANGPGDLHGWTVWTCFQWSGTDIDKDIFNGDAATWRALGAQGEDMTFTATDAKVVWTSDNIVKAPDASTTNPYWAPASYLIETFKQARTGQQAATNLGAKVDTLTVQVTALAAALTALSTAQGVDAEEIKAIVQAGVDEALADVKITLATNPAT